MLDHRINSIGDFLLIANEIKIGSAILIVIVGYLIGFAISPLGRYLYMNLGFRIWKPKFNNIEDLTISDKYVLVREFSPNNFKYIETWNMLSGMSHNLAVCCLFAIIILFTRTLFIPIKDAFLWLGLLASFFTLFFLFLYRAVIFYQWAASDINSSIAKLKLQEKSEGASHGAISSSH